MLAIRLTGKDVEALTSEHAVEISTDFDEYRKSNTTDQKRSRRVFNISKWT